MLHDGDSMAHPQSMKTRTYTGVLVRACTAKAFHWGVVGVWSDCQDDNDGINTGPVHSLIYYTRDVCEIYRETIELSDAN